MVINNRILKEQNLGVKGKAIRGFIIVYIAGAAGVFANLLGGETGGSSSFIIIWLAMYALSIPLILSEAARNTLKGTVSVREIVSVIFCVFVLSSFLWSKLPMQSFRYSFSLVLNICFAWYCAKKLSVFEFCKILMVVLNWMIPAGLLLGFAGVHSAIYIDPDTRSNILGTALIQGLFSHKIYAGYYGAVAMMLNIALLRGWKRWIMVLLALVSVAVSGSSIGIMAAVACLISLVALPMLRDRSLRIIALFGGVALFSIGAVFFTSLLEMATSSLGRDMTLTGRTEIWGYAIQFWSEKPLLGWGYGGIFGDAANAPGNIVRVNGYYQAPHFHDVYLQAAAELGIIGLFTYIFIVGTALFRTLSRAWNSKSSIDIVAASILIVAYSIGVGMNIGLRYNELTTIVTFFLFFANSTPFILSRQQRSRYLESAVRPRGQI